MLGKEAKISTSPKLKIGIGLVAQDIFTKMYRYRQKFCKSPKLKIGHKSCCTRHT
jgi:hypothetical protein